MTSDAAINKHIKELEGEVEQRDHKGVFFKGHYNPQGEEKDLLKELRTIGDDYFSKESVLKSKIKESLNSLLPYGFNVNDLKIDGAAVSFSAHCPEMHIEDKRPQPMGIAPRKELTPYEQIAQRHDLKAILNSGILSQKEKRKVLGLPEEMEE